MYSFCESENNCQTQDIFDVRRIIYYFLCMVKGQMH